jgi:hypothetical protein
MKTWLKRISKVAAVVLAATFVFGAVQARASLAVSYSASTSDNDGACIATALFQTVVVSGSVELEMTLTNTESRTNSIGTAISGLQFSVGQSSLLPTAFKEIQGTQTNFDGTAGTAVNATPPTSAQHWSFLSPSGGSTTSVWTVDSSKDGLNGYGSQPFDLIVSASNGNSSPPSSIDQHDPSFVGPVNFFFATSLSSTEDLTLADISSVKFSFGTGPEVDLYSGTGGPVPPPPPAVIPEPTSLAVWGIVSAATAGTVALRKQKRGRGRWSEANRSAIYEVIGGRTRI